MSCDDLTIFIYAGATWFEPTFDYLDDATDSIIPLTGLNARGTLKNSAGTVVLTLDSVGGSPPNLIVTASLGRVAPNLASTATGALAVNNLRTELTLHLELYDASTPPVVTPFGTYAVIVQPDDIP